MFAGFSAAVIWERSQLSTMGKEIGYFSFSEWSFSAFPEKQGGQATNLKPGNLVGSHGKEA